MSARKRPIPPRSLQPDRPPVPHLYVEDPEIPVDPWTLEGRCVTCGGLQRSDIHELPDASEAAEEGARRIGERGEPDGGA